MDTNTLYEPLIPPSEFKVNYNFKSNDDNEQSKPLHTTSILYLVSLFLGSFFLIIFAIGTSATPFRQVFAPVIYGSDDSGYPLYHYENVDFGLSRFLIFLMVLSILFVVLYCIGLYGSYSNKLPLKIKPILINVPLLLCFLIQAIVLCIAFNHKNDQGNTIGHLGEIDSRTGGLFGFASILCCFILIVSSLYSFFYRSISSFFYRSISSFFDSDKKRKKIQQLEQYIEQLEQNQNSQLRSYSVQSSVQQRIGHLSNYLGQLRNLQSQLMNSSLQNNNYNNYNNNNYNNNNYNNYNNQNNTNNNYNNNNNNTFNNNTFNNNNNNNNNTFNNNTFNNNNSFNNNNHVAINSNNPSATPASTS